MSATVRPIYAVFNTNTAAAFGILGWMSMDLIRKKGKFSLVGACEGAIAGLVGITPAAGYVRFWYAALIGFLTGAACSSLHKLNDWIRVDEGLDVFKLHGVGGIIGGLLTGVFADERISALDGNSRHPGAVNGDGSQVGRQLAGILAITVYAFVATCAICIALKYSPGLGLRVSAEAEMRGLDMDQFAEEQVGDWSVSWRCDGVHPTHTQDIAAISDTQNSDVGEDHGVPGEEVKN